MDYPYNRIEGQTNTEDHRVFVDVHVFSEFLPVDEAALTQVIQQWLLDNVPEVVSTTAQRREQTFPITDLPPLPG
ncbi:hypothetical protein OIA45_48430 (plasmid) [Streptomyces chartreusis]|uniref:hypothetical protein n=1 Tax=Streptomyces chartreusis TaxID=1969 RepID=UPI0037DD5194|nr:hypothetical protein OIA45_48430 [Streptomyces chartreusis]